MKNRYWTYEGFHLRETKEHAEVFNCGRSELEFVRQPIEVGRVGVVF